MALSIAITLGTHLLVEFARLNLAYSRHIWGDVPILVVDGKSERSDEIEALADEYGAYYLGERENRGHFAGDIQNTVAGLAFAREHGCDLLCKLNQRLVLVNPEVKRLIENVFSHEHVDLAMPGQIHPHAVSMRGKKFYASFPFLVDVIFMRLPPFSAEFLLEEYINQVKTGADPKYKYYVETLWRNLVKGPFSRRFARLDFLTEHQPKQWPVMFLRKTFNSSADYLYYARKLKLPDSEFFMGEWNAAWGKSYNPFPRSI